MKKETEEKKIRGKALIFSTITRTITIMLELDFANIYWNLSKQ
jgi:hypothetical protein